MRINTTRFDKVDYILFVFRKGWIIRLFVRAFDTAIVDKVDHKLFVFRKNRLIVLTGRTFDLSFVIVLFWVCCYFFFRTLRFKLSTSNPVSLSSPCKHFVLTDMCSEYCEYCDMSFIPLI